MWGRVDSIYGNSDASVSFTCSCDRLDCISNEIEHYLFQLRAIAVNGRQMIGGIKVNPHLVRRGLRSHQNQRLLQHVSYVDSADMWAATAEKIPHTTHHPAGMIDLCNHGRQIVVGPALIAARHAQKVLRGSCESASSRHRLVDLVDQRRRHPAHEIEA